MADPAHDRADGLRFVLTVDARDAETHCRRRDVAVANRGFHHLVQHFLDAELARGMQVGPRSACVGHDLPLSVRQQTHRLRPAGVDSEYMHDIRILVEV